MSYPLRYHPLILQEDFKRIDRPQQQRLLRTIEKNSVRGLTNTAGR